MDAIIDGLKKQIQLALANGEYMKAQDLAGALCAIANWC